MALRVPPPEIPVISWLTPNKTDQGLLEFWNTELASYVPLDIGAPHPNQRQYPNFVLGKQSPVQGDEKWVLRTWVTDETSPDWFNWANKFAGEDAEFPTFIRTYREPRDTYTPRTKGEPLGTLYKTVIKNPGSGYANGAYPTIEFADSVVEPTSVAIAHAVVAPDGTITEAVLDFGGEGYEADVEFTVTYPISGTTATGIAYVQPQTAVLTREEASLFPPDSEFYAGYLQVVRVYETIPGPTFNSTEFAEDGAIVNVATTRKFCSDITTEESIVTGTWCQTTSKPTDIDVICEESVKCRAIPGFPMVSIKIEKDGKTLEIAKTLKDVTTITPSEVVTGGGVWVKTEQEDYQDTSLVAWEIVSARDALGNYVPSAKVDGDHEVATTNTRLRKTGDITPSATESGGFITTVEKGEVGDLVSEEITTVTRWLDKASYAISIINLIPREFMAFIPTFTESHIIAGTASMPSIGTGEFEHSKRQLTKLLYEERIVSLGAISLPITHTNQELTEEYGGGVLNVTYTLETQGTGTIDEGLLVTEASLVDLGNGMEVKTTKELDDTAWPILEGTEVDPRTGIVIGIEKQVVDAGATGGVLAGVYTDVKSIDKWRSITIASSLDPDTLPDPIVWETTEKFSFPDTLNSATWIWAAATGTLSYAFDSALITDIAEGYSGPCRAKVTETFSNGAPADVVAITQFFPQAHTIGFAWAIAFDLVDGCGSCRDDTRAHAQTWFIPPTLHDEITISGGVTIDNGSITTTLPATDPIALPTPGTLITASVEVEPWRFGVFYRKMTEIYVPG